MKVSIVIPSYNHRDFVESSIRSVYAQSYEDINLLVIDDGSTDGSVELIKRLQGELGFDFIAKENQGICATLNMGIEKTSSECILFLASDDVLPENRISEQVDEMQSRPEVDVLVGAMEIIDDQGQVVSVKDAPDCHFFGFSENIPRCQVKSPTALYRRRTFDNFGKYREDLMMEDFEFWLRILSNGAKVFSRNMVWAKYRVSMQGIERKFEHYYDGKREALALFDSSGISEKSLLRVDQIYLIKKFLLNGRLKKEQDQVLFKKMPGGFRIFGRFLGLIPQQIRMRLVKTLVYHY